VNRERPTNVIQAPAAKKAKKIASEDEADEVKPEVKKVGFSPFR
jgi:hypothetical protein